MKGKGGRWNELLLIAEKSDGEDIGSAIITDYMYTKRVGRQNFLDYVPFGGALLDNSASLRSFIRGIEQKTFQDDSAFSLSFTDWGEKAIQFVLPKSWHGGWVDRTLNFFVMLFSLFFMAFAGVPLLIIPYMTVVSLTIGKKKFLNGQINIMGLLAGMVFLLPGILLFAASESPFVGLLIVVVTIVVGLIVYGGISGVLSWNRCNDCLGWETFGFTRYLKEGEPMKKTTTKTETTPDRYKVYSDGRRELVSKGTTTVRTYIEHYRDVTKEYVCNACKSTREIDKRETLSEQTAEQLARNFSQTK
jgi:hypothetical protein